MKTFFFWGYTATTENIVARIVHFFFSFSGNFFSLLLHQGMKKRILDTPLTYGLSFHEMKVLKKNLGIHCLYMRLKRKFKNTIGNTLLICGQLHISPRYEIKV